MAMIAEAIAKKKGEAMTLIQKARAWLNGTPTLGKAIKKNRQELQITLVYPHISWTVSLFYADRKRAELAQQSLVIWFAASSANTLFLQESTVITKKDLLCLQAILV